MPTLQPPTPRDVALDDAARRSSTHADLITALRAVEHDTAEALNALAGGAHPGDLVELTRHLRMIGAHTATMALYGAQLRPTAEARRA